MTYNTRDVKHQEICVYLYKGDLSHEKSQILVFVLEGDILEQWEQAREACERLAGQTLSDTQALKLMCAEVLCTYATTPPFDPDDEEDGGSARNIAERDGWQCTRPGCSCRSGLTGNHIIPRGGGGPDEDWNIHLLFAACHLAITEGRLKVSGRAPDGLTWEGPFGVIEKPLPLDREPQTKDTDQKDDSTKNVDVDAERYPEGEQNETLFVRESGAEYIFASHVGHARGDGQITTSHMIPKDLESNPHLGLRLREHSSTSA